MNIKSALLAATLVAVGLGSQANALTVTNSDIVSGEGELVSKNGLGFDWDSTPFAAYFEFTTKNAFDLKLARYGEDYVINTEERSGYTLDFLLGGTATRLTTDADACRSAADPIGGACNLITSGGKTGMQPGDTLMSGLEAGSYRLGFFDSSRPEAGFAEFSVDEVAPVPLPAAGGLLLAALGGLGFARKRKTA